MQVFLLLHTQINFFVLKRRRSCLTQKKLLHFLNFKLLGLSIDSIHAHIAWARSIEENFGVKITFPIIADLSMEVAKAYGMIQPGASDTAAVRATFIIDPEGILRAMVYYPMSNGRSIDEFYVYLKHYKHLMNIKWRRLKVGNQVKRLLCNHLQQQKQLTHVNLKDITMWIGILVLNLFNF